MSQNTSIHEETTTPQGDEHNHGGSTLGPLLCWAVVFADIGTSIYYVPGILYGTVGNLAGFFVFLTLSVFVLLTLKYTEVTHRFPQGGGVVTVAAQAMNHWFGALGGMFILVDYFLTAAISCLSGMQYLSVVIPILGTLVAIPIFGQIQLAILTLTVIILILLGILNWYGVSESAKVSLVGAIIAFLSDLAILFTVFTHISISQFLSLFTEIFVGHTLTPYSILTGFAGSFLAFSGLESISQLSPVMKQPRKNIAGMAMFLVIITIGITSPILTLFSTTLLPRQAADPVLSSQLISLLAGHWGSVVLQTEVAISASALLVFASNTAIIGSYHVFLALSRMEFLPNFIQRRNRLRGTPHYSIALATGIPIVILIVVLGNITILGDMYAFGLLGAFSLTCLGLDIVRYRDWQATRKAIHARHSPAEDTHVQEDEARSDNKYIPSNTDEHNYTVAIVGQHTNTNGQTIANAHPSANAPESASLEGKGLWFKIDFFLGIATTFLVILAWSTNLVTKQLATAFGGSVTVLGMLIAYTNYIYHERRGRIPVSVVATVVEESIPNSVLAVLTAANGHNEAVIRAAVNNTDKRNALVFLYVGEQKARETAPSMMEIVDPYLEDEHAKEYFGKAESIARKAKLPTRRFIYLQAEPDAVAHAWQIIHPHDTVVAIERRQEFQDINPDRIRYELTTDGKVAHLIKNW